MDGLPDSVRVVEVGPRDGLQNEPEPVPVQAKIALIEALAAAGLPMVEATSFVSPRWVPQLADAHDVLTGIRRRPGVAYPVLVPNVRGLERALAAGAGHVAIFTAASETFSRKNTNATIAQSIDRLRAVAGEALAARVPVRGYISCVLGCPYEGPIPVAGVIAVAEQLLAMGCSEISLGDTIGIGTPGAARDMLEQVAQVTGMDRLAVHFHDTRGQALANILACLQAGVATVDASVAGLGGCPYAAGATGNVATEDLVYMLHGLGIRTGIDLPAVVRAGQEISHALGRTPNSRLGRLPEYRQTGRNENRNNEHATKD
jgi:hydroxymethylglutaryl-CoA lyase